MKQDLIEVYDSLKKKIEGESLKWKLGKQA